MSGRNRRNLRFLRGDNDEIIHRFYNEQCVLVSESFARRFQVAEGDTLKLPSPAGVEAFPIAGVFYDYTRDQGTVFLSQKNFRTLWHDERVNSLGVYLKTGADPAAVAEDFRARFSRSGEFSIYSNRLLRTRIFEIFDQTFAVTYVLRTIAVLVAVIGIFLGLTTLVTERSRELGVHALGRRLGGADPAAAPLGKRHDRAARERPRARGRALSFGGADGRDQSRIFRLDDSAGFPLGVARLDAALDHRRGDRGGMDSGLARGAAGYRGGSAERMRKFTHFVVAVLGLFCVAADWQVAEPGWQLRVPARSSSARRFQDGMVVFHRQPDERPRPALWLRADFFPAGNSAA